MTHYLTTLMRALGIFAHRSPIALHFTLDLGVVTPTAFWTPVKWVSLFLFPSEQSADLLSQRACEFGDVTPGIRRPRSLNSALPPLFIYALWLSLCLCLAAVC